MSEPIDSMLSFPRPVRLTLREDFVGLADPVPAKGKTIYRAVSVDMSVMMGERVLSTCTYTWEHGRRLLEGPFFLEPVFLGLLAVKSAGRERGLLRVALVAGPTCPEQEAFLMDLDTLGEESLGLWTLPGDHPGLPLGERWFPAGPDVLRPIATDSPTFAGELEEFGNACKLFFDRILYGDPSEEAERLLASI